jgi:Spy/CpxP family protein refolding chaperone
MAEIRRGYETEMLSTGRRLREARTALDAAIMTEPLDQADINRRTEDLVAAQSDRIRLQTRMRAEVRGVLTPAQVIRFQQIERRLRRQMRMRQQTADPSNNPDDILR